MYIVIAICGILLGLAVGFFMGRSSAPKNDAEIEALRLSMKEKEDNFKSLLKEKDENTLQLLKEKENSAKEAYTRLQENHQREIDTLKENNSRLIENMENNHREALQSLKERFAEISTSMSEQLKNTTREMLKERQQEFTESSGEKIGQLLQPLKDSLKNMQDKVSENTTRHTELGGQLSASIKNLLNHTESAQASADRLASMLKGNSKRQGEWGERILKEILESLNLQEGIHFDLQQTLTDEKGNVQKNDEGRKGKPDVILHLDQNKDVIIDSKVSLTGYLEYMEAESEPERQEALKKHITSLENHVKELERKDYAGYVNKTRERLGYVIMFVPNTSALLLATNAKPTLWREAMEKNVYIADEQTLYAALKIVSLTWRQIKQNANHQEVFRLADEMLKRVTDFLKPLNDIGEKLTSATESYDTALKKLQEGGQSIPQTCRKLIKLGGKLPPKLPKGVDVSLFGEEAGD